MGVGTRHCRVLTVSNINSDATGVDINTDLDIDQTHKLKYTQKKIAPPSCFFLPAKYQGVHLRVNK
jgi:hypothetical protein